MTRRCLQRWASVLGMVVGLLVASGVVAGNASAQAWIREPGHVYAKLGYRLIRASSLYFPDGSVQPVGDGFRQHALGFYTEVGVIERWLSLSLDGDLFRRSVLVNQGATSGVGDLRVGAYTGLVTEPFRLALGVQLGLPIGDPFPSAGPGASEDDQLIADSLPTGDGEWDVAVRLYAGHAFGGGRRWPFNHYVVAELGAWFRGLGYTDAPLVEQPAREQVQFVFRAEIGLTPTREGWDRLQLALRLVGVQPFQQSGQRSTVGLGAGTSFVSPGIELSVRTLDTLRIGMSVDSAFVARNVPAGLNWQWYLSWER